MVTFLFFRFLNGTWRGQLCICIYAYHDSVVDFAVVIKLILSICLSDSVVELDNIIIFDRCILEHFLVKDFLGDS